MRKLLSSLLSAIAIAGSTVSPSATAQNSPPITPAAGITERIQGKNLKEPYRWMENSDDPSLQYWLKTQEAYTEARTAGALRDQLAKEYAEIYPPTRGASPLLDRPSRLLDLEGRIFDRHRFKLEDGRRTGVLAASASRRYELYAGPAYTDIKVLQIKDTQTGAFLRDVINVKFASVIWDKDDTSFLYCTARDGRLGGATCVVRRHILGADPRGDVTLFESEDVQESCAIFSKGAYTWIEVSCPSAYTLSTMDVSTGAREIILQTKGGMALSSFYGDLFIYTSFTSEDMGEIVSFDPVSRALSTVVSARDVPVDKLAVGGDDLYVAYVRNGANELLRHTITTGVARVIGLPEQGSVSITEASSSGILFDLDTCTSYATYKYDAATDQVTLVSQGAKPDVELEATLVEYVPVKGWKSVMWVVKRKDVTFSADTPLFMYGYGGFRVNILPFYSGQYLPWLRRGGALAIVILPGGLEYGEAWHRLGSGLNKRNVFDAFASAAQTLISKGWTSPDRIAINGASNGGLLVSATAMRYPKLFRVAVPEVGVHDMIRFPLFTCGAGWIPDYGDPKIPADFKNLLSFSPCDRTKKGMRLPSMIVVTSDQDDRVVPSHSYKLAAALQAAMPTTPPILLHVAHGTGHNVYGATAAENARTFSTIWSFVMQEVGME